MKSVRIGDSVFKAAESEAAIMSRSTAGQIEHWINIGRRAEALMSATDIRDICSVSFSDDIDALKEFYRGHEDDSFKRGEVTSADGFSAVKGAGRATAHYANVDF